MQAYWRSCAMILGCVLEQAFKDEYSVTLVKAPEVPGNITLWKSITMNIENNFCNLHISKM